MEQLFTSLCDIVFTYPDNSQICCKSTLNPDILAERGYQDVNGFVDFSSGKLIPEDLFTYEFEILPEGTAQLSELDKMFEAGGKLHWMTIS